MSDEDPFSEPDDTDRTVIRPNPGGRRPAAPRPAAPAPAAPPAAVPAPGPAPRGISAETDAGAETFGVPGAAATPRAASREATADLASGLTGLNPINACAATLFSLVSRIRNRAQHPDPEALRQSVIAEIRAFENRAMKAGIDAQHVKIARYAICATIDDVVLNTPWGEHSVWAQQSMVSTFHRETVGGDRFFDLLARLEKDPGGNIDLLEFLYACLSLGFEGRLRVERGGPDKHMSIRAGLAEIIRAQRGEIERDLSPRWHGVDKPYRPVSAWKAVWIAAGVAVAVMGSLFVGFSYALSGSTGEVVGQFTALDPGGTVELERRAPPVIPPPPDNVELERVSSFLQEEIRDGIVKVFQDANTVTVRITGTGMFASGSATLQAAFEVPLTRVALALEDTRGPVLIAGHSDNVPIRSAKFPSNMHLSLARAESVMAQIAQHLSDASRLKAEGRADREPIESNDTREGRAANRRIEIVLLKEYVE